MTYQDELVWRYKNIHFDKNNQQNVFRILAINESFLVEIDIVPEFSQLYYFVSKHIYILFDDTEALFIYKQKNLSVSIAKLFAVTT